MKFKELVEKIDKMINASPYSKEEVLGILSQEDELTPNELIVLCTALEYSIKYQDPHTELIRGLYLKKLEELKKQYSIT